MEEQLDIPLIQETKCREETTRSLLRKSWNNLDSIAIDSQGFSGGLALAWNRNKVQMVQFWVTKRTIKTRFTYIGTTTTGFVTNVYGSYTISEKLQFIADLNYFSNLTVGDHWIIDGDYNMIKSLEEKKGGTQ